MSHNPAALPGTSVRTLEASGSGQAYRIYVSAPVEAPPPPACSVRTWLMWIRRPGNAGLDAVYLAGAHLRPFTGCSAPMARLGALLARIHLGP